MKITNIKTGAVGVCWANREISEVIKFSTNSKFSHTCQFFWWNGILYVIDAQDRGFIPVTFENWKNKWKYEMIVFNPPYPIDEKQWCINAMNYSGVQYDKKGLAVGLFRSLINRGKEIFGLETNKDMKDKYRNNGLFWCSEATMRLIGAANPEDYSPQDVYDYLINNNWQIVEL